MPFVPLAFWNSIIGKFMFFLPITLIITLTASLLVAYVINPVFAVSFMKPHDEANNKRRFTKGDKITLIIFGAIALLCYLSKSLAMGNFVVFVYLFIQLEKYVLSKWIHAFQNRAWPAFKEWYTRWLKRALSRPILVLVVTILLFPVAIMSYMARHVPFTLFPSPDPNFAYVYLNLPVGTDQAYTNQVMKDLERKVNNVLNIDPEKGKSNPVVLSVISNVTVNAVDPGTMEIGDFPNKG